MPQHIAHLPDDRSAAWRDAAAATSVLRRALAERGIVLPSLGVDPLGPVAGVNLVELGRVRPDVAIALAGALECGGQGLSDGRTP
ncbi:hypothetical protein [Streptomyces montanisoli]|uniref:Uncharacterized protein n=1 Tax=Streptomyces montanisoli TaxID=2798581 RepID=A0A940MGB8_9ACTN|nr:hypothetical protein [Streptomyces montanisoli]MBP0459791.1 hypothetical protein [Streptomyces montanisoli]